MIVPLKSPFILDFCTLNIPPFTCTTGGGGAGSTPA